MRPEVTFEKAMGALNSGFQVKVIVSTGEFTFDARTPMVGLNHLTWADFMGGTWYIVGDTM